MRVSLAPTPSRRSRFRIAAVALPFVLLGLAELTLRATGGGAPPAPPGGFLGLDDPRFYERDPELLWRLRKGVVLDGPDAGFEQAWIGSRGLRGDAPDAPKAPGEVRVICCGDSVTFGLGLRDGETVPARIEAALRDEPALSGRTVRVLDAGVPGYGAVQGAAWLEALRDLEPDVVVWWFGMNDSKPAAGRTDAQWIAAGGFPWDAGRGGGLRVVTALARLFADAPPDPSLTRVPPHDFAERVARLSAGAQGPAVVFLEVPQRLDDTALEIETVIRLARERGATRVLVPGRLASAYTPSDLDLAPERFVLADQGTPGDGGATLRYRGEGADTALAVDELEAAAQLARRWSADLAALMRCLPDDRVRAADLVASDATRASFTDNCHLTATGAEHAARVIAGAVLDRIPPR